MKERGTSHWADPNTDATDRYGFTGLPAGMRNYDGGFEQLTLACGFWSSTAGDGSTPVFYLNYGSADVYQNYEDNRTGRSIRCIRD